MMMDQKSPAELPKSVFAHERITRTLDARGDAPQLTSMETRPTARYARQSTGALVDQMPWLLGRDPVRVPGDDWLLQVVLNAPGASWIAALQEQEQTKNEEEEQLGLGEKDVVDVFCSIVCCFNRPSPLLFKRGLDFPYKTRTQISVQRVKNTSQIRILQNLPESA